MGKRKWLQYVDIVLLKFRGHKQKHSRYWSCKTQQGQEKIGEKKPHRQLNNSMLSKLKATKDYSRQRFFQLTPVDP